MYNFVIRNPDIYISDKTYKNIRNSQACYHYSLLTHAVSCKKNEFACLNGYGCLERAQLCDEFHLCLDGSDETDCLGKSDKLYKNIFIQIIWSSVFKRFLNDSGNPI